MDSTTKTIQQSYPWITSEFFEEILQKVEAQQQQPIKVDSFTVDAALGKGQNYGSNMLRAIVTYRKAHDSNSVSLPLIIKCGIISNPDLAKYHAELGLFRKEINIYERVLPEVEKRLRSIGDDTKLGPMCYGASVENSYLVFEDLTTAGYGTVSKSLGLDVPHYKIVLNKIARWHAVTAVMLQEDPSWADQYQLSPYQHRTSLYENIMTSVARAARDWHSNELADKIFAFSKRAYDKVVESCQRDAADLNVINHGDLWSNNVMYQHVADNENETEQVRPTDAIILDFQGCYWGSPMIDMLTLLVTCSQKNLVTDDWNGLIEFYFAELNDLLVRLKYSRTTVPVSRSTIDIEKKRRGSYSLPMAFLSLALRNMREEDDDGDSFSKFLGNTDRERVFRETIMSDPIIRSNMLFLLNHFDENGFFD